jgi:nitrous oxidase accessory protein NosD
MSRTRSLGLNAGIATALAIAASTIAVAPASATHVQCGDVITQDTTLDGDLTCAGDGLTVGAPDVTLDLAGHTIQGSRGNRGVIDSGERTDVSGGTIRGFSAGVGIDGPIDTLVHDMLFEQNGVGVDCTFSPGCSVLDSELRNGVVGIRMSSPDNPSSQLSLIQRNHVHDNGFGILLAQYRANVTDNRIENNDTLGVEIDFTSLVEMSRNIVAGNDGDGVVVSFLSSATISNNQIVRNGGDGVAVLGDLFFGNTEAVVRGNRIARNGGDGVLVEAEGAHAVIARNRTERNGDDGIDINAGANTPPDAVDTVVRANRAFFNTDLGIEAVAGTTDGGGNRARHNGNPAQCVGVVCR